MSARAVHRIQPLADRVGIAASIACTIHCLATPILLVLGVTVPLGILRDERVHAALLWVIVPAAVLALGLGCWRHRDLPTLLLGVAGVVGLSLAALVLGARVGAGAEVAVTVISSLLLITAHVRNYLACRRTACACTGTGTAQD